MKLLMFSKMLQQCNLKDVAMHAKALGFHGIDLTVRPGGHISPENVARELPQALSQLKDFGLELPMISTGFINSSDEWATEVFKTAGECGIKYIKLGYRWMGDFGETREVLNSTKCALDSIEKLAKVNGVCALMHIHNGFTLNSVPALVWMLLADRDTRHIGAYIDPAHMAVEGGAAGWMIGMDILKPYTKLVSVKNFCWEKTEGMLCTIWNHRICPLREGIAPWPDVLGLLDRMGYDGYLSIHSEYNDEVSLRVLDRQELLNQTAEDIAYLRSISDRIDY